MKHVFLKFAVAVLAASLAFVVIPILAHQRGWVDLKPSFSGEIVSSLAILTLGLFYYLRKVQQSNPQKFIQAYLLSITIKMVVGCVLILLLIFLDRQGAIANSLLFILSYFALTGIEIFFLLRGKTIA